MCICALFSLFGCAFIFSLFMLVVFGFLFCWCRDFCTHNEDIVTCRCGGGESHSSFLQKVFKNSTKKNFVLCFFGSSVLYLIGFEPLKLDY